MDRIPEATGDGQAALIQPKYHIGDTVWVAVTKASVEYWPCPDCNGTKQWVATTAAGEQIAVQCPRCMTFTFDKLPSLRRQRLTAAVRQLTIGSIRTDTAAKDGEHVAYMCHETGIGSGNTYYERLLFATEPEALESSARFVAKAQEQADAQPEALIAAMFAALPLRVALMRAWRADVWHGWDTARHLTETIERVLEEDKDLSDDTRWALQNAMEKKPWRTPHPIDVLLDAARGIPELADAVAALMKVGANDDD